jgi:hypothetical protein
MQRLPLILSSAAVVVAVFGSTPLGKATAAEIVPFAKFAQNAGAVNGIKAYACRWKARSPRQEQASVGVAGPQGPKGDTGATGSAGPAGPAGTVGVSGYEIVSVSTNLNSKSSNVATASCPSGKKVVGGGGFENAAPLPNPVALYYDGPVPSGNSATGWAVGAEETSDYPAQWQVFAFAICVNVAS